MSAHREHSKISPSKLAILEKCHCFRADNKTSEIAKRGVAIGEAIANALMGLEVPKDMYKSESFHYGLDAIKTVIELHNLQDWTITPERKLYIIPPVIWGYADIVITNDADNSIAYLFEIKSGYAQDREPADSNIQLQSYAMGLINEGYQQVKVYLIELDRQTTSLDCVTTNDKEEIKDKIVKIIEKMIKAETTTVGSYCNYCINMTGCPEYTESLPTVIDTINTEMEPKEFARTLSPVMLSQILHHILPLFSKAEKYVNELKARAMAFIESGVKVPGLDVKTISGNRTWKDETGATWRISELYPNANIMHLKSVAQVEKELKDIGIKKKDIDTLLSELAIKSEKKQLITI